MTDGCFCQYCDEPREFIGYFGRSPVSLCVKHRKEHGRDFDSVRAIDAAWIAERAQSEVK